MSFSTRTNGKLLLTAEYFVTEGAVALALPTQLGQTLEVKKRRGTKKNQLEWKSYDHEGELWFEATFGLPGFAIEEVDGGADKSEVAERLQEILQTTKQLNPEFLKKGHHEATTKLEFPRDWGLGSSATLIAMLADWAEVDPFTLLDATFGGSGYDLVTAKAEGPVLFQKFNETNRWDTSLFDPPFKDQLYFVHLGKKQSSKEALVYYKIAPEEVRCAPIGRITQITHDIAQYTQDLATFEDLVEEHEELVHEVIQQPTAKSLYFEDYWGAVKSLGAWGGDFVLVTSDKGEEATRAYFEDKGFGTFLRYEEMIKEAAVHCD